MAVAKNEDYFSLCWGPDLCHRYHHYPYNIPRKEAKKRVVEEFKQGRVFGPAKKEVVKKITAVNRKAVKFSKAIMPDRVFQHFPARAHDFLHSITVFVYLEGRYNSDIFRARNGLVRLNVNL